MRYVSINLASALLIAITGFLATPGAASAQGTQIDWSLHQQSYLEFMLRFSCERLETLRLELVQAEEDLSIIEGVLETVNSRLAAAQAAGEGVTTVYPGGYAAYNGTPEYEQAGELRDSFVRHLREARTTVSSLTYVIEIHEKTCTDVQAELNRRTAQRNQSVPPSPAGSNAEYEAQNRRLGVLDMDALEREIRETRTALDLAAREGELALDAVDRLSHTPAAEQRNGGRNGATEETRTPR